MNSPLTPLLELHPRVPQLCILCSPEQSSQAMLCARAGKMSKPLALPHKRKKPHLTSRVFPGSGSAFSAANNWNHLSPLFALALAAHVQQANTNLCASQKFQAQPPPRAQGGE